MYNRQEIKAIQETILKTTENYCGEADGRKFYAVVEEVNWYLDGEDEEDRFSLKVRFGYEYYPDGKTEDMAEDFQKIEFQQWNVEIDTDGTETLDYFVGFINGYLMKADGF